MKIDRKKYLLARANARMSINARSEMVRLLAAKDVLDRAGFRPDDNVNANTDTDLHITIDYGD